MTENPTRAEVDQMKGAVVLEFGADWCPICQGARPLIADVLSRRPDVAHVRVEDGKGKALGRSFRVKLWPTLVFLRDGTEVARVVRPEDEADFAEALTHLSPP